MKKLMPLYIFCCVMIPLLSRAEDLPPSVVEATDHFQDILKDLKESVERLTVSNAQFVVQNQNVAAQIAQMRVRIGQLEAENQALAQGVDKLKGTSEAKARDIEAAQNKLRSFDDDFEKIADEIKRVSQGVDQKNKEDAAVDKQLLAMPAVVPVAPAPPAPAKPDARKEKLKIMKMIMDSKQHQERLQEQIMAAGQGSVISGGNALIQARKAYLEDAIKKAEQELAQLPAAPAKVSVDESWNDAQAREMEGELKTLKKNHDELESLVGQIQKKVAMGQAVPQELGEQHKLEASIDELKREGAALKADLEGLRTQMVELDKRKSNLESILQQ